MSKKFVGYFLSDLAFSSLQFILGIIGLRSNSNGIVGSSRGRSRRMIGWGERFFAVALPMEFLAAAADRQQKEQDNDRMG